MTSYECMLLRAEIARLKDRLAAIESGLDFAPDEKHEIADMANCGYSLMQAIKAHRPGYAWGNTPAEIVGDLCNQITELEGTHRP